MDVVNSELSGAIDTAELILKASKQERTGQLKAFQPKASKMGLKEHFCYSAVLLTTMSQFQISIL
jgi:hypothetical protein